MVVIKYISIHKVWSVYSHRSLRGVIYVLVIHMLIDIIFSLVSYRQE